MAIPYYGRIVLLCLSSLFFGPILTGCSGEPPTYRTKGQVVYRDGQPFTAGGYIQFESTTPPYTRSMSDLSPDGSFVLSTLREGSGSIAGEHRVCVIPALTEPLVEGIARQRVIDPKYCAFATSGLVVTVEAKSGNMFTIEVDRPVGANQRR